MASRSVFSAVKRSGVLAARAPSAAPLRQFSTAGAQTNEFIAERQHIKDHAAKSADLWRKVSMYVCLPGALVLGVYIYGIEAEHIHHRDHEIEENGGELPERTFYEYNNIRKKEFPWGKESFFHNSKANYVPE
ncbi:mitochondrial cytochrome c oxidase subunit VIa [Tilletiaria anomala UBC 951]|uniref:Mitochondrial cytochrome c oxidase subunit VIa n=1 Tax=Tilletiaria anomala (strain ATCC 24038 / CBS 436.72 / UBC 951) TaxID=1037660 RepID=A0A066WJP4_TILAU|nr:mitochondrial cytochrome c oxidase subunit VIa [Tilletiaria anomala UBC 951]KDN50845.1 mitochondrial cytochrome c oxidase subunit VIa [Tilletiaria anomala UBC 951]